MSCEVGAGGEPAIVVGVNGSAAAWDALAWAAAEAAATERPLRVVFVARVPTAPDMYAMTSVDRSAALLVAGAELVADGARRAREIAPDLEVITQVEAGDVAESLVRAASRDAMIVVGKQCSHRRRWRRYRRPTAVAVARRTRCPVAVVELMDDADGDFAGRVVVLDDAPGEESPAMAYARGAASLRGVEVVVLTSGSPLPPGGGGAALVVLGARRSERVRRRITVATSLALVTATGPTVVVPA